MRWDLIDKFEVLKKKKSEGDLASYARARKSFTGSEDFFNEHFPGNPVVPASLLIEMVAQAGGVLFGLGFHFKKEVILAKISDASFAQPVKPPCDFVVEAVLESERDEGAWVEGKVYWNKKRVAEVRLLLATVDSLEGAEKKQIVFNDTFLKHAHVYEAAKAGETS
jgi:3-hydroxyacyl-[acyl-carrier-protein] dehydratase